MKIKFLIPILLFIFSCSKTEPIEQAKEATPEDLINHTEEFRKEIIEVTEGVHVAVGFALANAIMIEGDGSNVIIDTTGTVETAQEVKDYIRFIANRRLDQLGLEPIYKVDKNPLTWLDTMLNAVEHMNFFEGRATEYSKASTQGTWAEAFS